MTDKQKEGERQMTDTGKTYDRLTMDQGFAVLKLIEANGQKEGEYWTYTTGWDDSRVANEVGCDEPSVAYRRKKVFGQLRKGYHGANADHAAIMADIETLKTQAASLRVTDFQFQKRLEALEKTINLLLTAPVKEGISAERLQAMKKHLEGVRS